MIGHCGVASIILEFRESCRLNWGFILSWCYVRCWTACSLRRVTWLCDNVSTTTDDDMCGRNTVVHWFRRSVKSALEPTTSISKHRASSRALFARYRHGAASVDYGMLIKTVTHTHQGIWSSHLSTCLPICIYIYHTTSSNQSRDQIRLVSRPTLSVLKHYHVVQGNSPNISYSQTIANLKCNYSQLYSGLL